MFNHSNTIYPERRSFETSEIKAIIIYNSSSMYVYPRDFRMLARHFTALCGLLILACLIIEVTVPVQSLPSNEMEYYYGYFDYLTPDKKIIHLIHPGSPPVFSHQIRLPFESIVDKAHPYSITGIVPSPDGIHLLVRMMDKTIGQPSLFLYRTMTDDLERVDDLIFGDFVWSDNGLYFAFNAYVPTEGSSTQIFATYVYDTQTKSIKKLKETSLGLPKVQPTKLSFSPDGVHLSIFNKSCWNEVNCVGVLELFNIQNNALALKEEIPAQYNISMDYTCIGDWSPDGRYLAYVSVCDEWEARYFSELFLWDTAQNEVLQVTTYTNSLADIEASEQSPPEYLAHYSIIWLNTNTMLVGSLVAHVTPWQRGRTTHAVFDQAVIDNSTYIWPRAVINKIDTGSRVYFDLALHPTDKTRVAFRVERYTPNAIGELQLDPYRAQNAVHVAEFDGKNLHIIYQAEYGCGLKWSPDGEWLAYIATDGNETIYNRCSSMPRNVNFLKYATGEVSRYPEEPQAGFLDFFGWVALPAETP